MVTRALVVLLLAACAGDESLEAHIESIAPPVAARGARVDILGQHFCQVIDISTNGQCQLDLDAFVSFGNADGIWRRDLDTWSPDRIVLTVPASAAPGETAVVITVRGRPSLSASIRIE